MESRDQNTASNTSRSQAAWLRWAKTLGYVEKLMEGGTCSVPPPPQSATGGVGCKSRKKSAIMDLPVGVLGFFCYLLIIYFVSLHTI